MTEREPTLQRLFRESRDPEAAAPAFQRMWNAARAEAEQGSAKPVRWGDTLAAAAATASVLVIGLLLALDARRPPSRQAEDPALYSLLIARTTWRSPTDVLLETNAGQTLGSLPALPTVNTNPPVESLL